MARLLKAAGMESIAFSSSEKFLAHLNLRTFDCILLDVQLDGMSGLELHQQLITLGNQTPILFITAHDTPEIRHQAELAGCAAYFRKSDPGIDILTAIRNFVAAHSSLN